MYCANRDKEAADQLSVLGAVSGFDLVCKVKVLFTTALVGCYLPDYWALGGYTTDSVMHGKCSASPTNFQSPLYTVSHKKTCHFVFDNNSGVSWSIFILFVPVKKGRDTVQFTYLTAWWCHNCITLHVTKVWFIQSLLQVKYVQFEDRHKLFLSKTCGNVKIFLTADW